ncbi:hypothetical protein K2173_004614 [Erythroxylum novogranatense]|uniref:MOSC domain-containing protein n=1 Tax=Erythroxylum novogranatense TaxID=1862640 RepID=A0AAV8U7Z5_9ROSI|nr:hypothetical protein K2173_004614 [Erythroxylum novogranatense]
MEKVNGKGCGNLASVKASQGVFKAIQHGLFLCGFAIHKIICNEFGPIVAFNLKRPDGSWFGYREVEKLASLFGIHLRTGCFCNPGACAKNLGLSNEDLLLNLEAGHVCWDDNDIIHEKPTGAVRVSFGYMSTYEDAQVKILPCDPLVGLSLPTEFEEWCAGLSPLAEEDAWPVNARDQDKKLSSGCYYLKSVTIYPIKSCGGFCVGSWPLSSTGLLHDREWLLQNLSGDILTQKKVPEMCLISTFIDLDQGMMFVESPRCSGKLQINLQTGSCLGMREEIIMHGQRYKVCTYDADVNLWFSNAVGCACTLIRSNSHTSYSSKDSITGLCRDVESRLNFSNEAQFLLISDNSVSDLNSRLKSNAQKGTLATSAEVNPMRFRPNLVISGAEPYVEDRWRSLKIGNNYFMSLGGCNRCHMINLVHQDGQVQRLKEPLKTLSLYRRVKVSYENIH